MVWAKLSDVARRSVLKNKLLAVKKRKEQDRLEMERDFSLTGFGSSGL